MRLREPLDREFKYHMITPGDRERLLTWLKERLETYPEIVFAYAHGSFIERDYYRDVDIALWLDNVEKAWTFTVDVSARLEGSLGKPVDIQVLNKAPLPFQHHVYTKGVLILSRDEKQRSEVVNLTLRMYWDLRMLREQVTNDLQGNMDS